MTINESVFIKSSADVTECPNGVTERGETMMDYAFIGRSNVGKSSLINMLCGRTALAKVSATPGKTQLINHFCINKRWYMVDLPGYGYAKVAKSVKEKFQKLITRYIEKRDRLMVLFVLVDVRHEPQKIDVEFMRYLGEGGIPFNIIFTKADKLSEKQLAANVEAYKAKMLEEWEELPRCFVTSSARSIGRDEVLGYVEELLELETEASGQE